jgi:hypothetical protein
LSVVIPSSVKVIGGYAFSHCSSLASVVIPSSVTKIAGYAFCDCESLESVEFGGTVAQWEAMEKEDGWRNCVPSTIVKCSDGEAWL